MKPNWFIGLPLRDDWVPRAIDGLPAGLRTFHGEDIHITVAFLGAVGAEKAQAAWQAVAGQKDLAEPWNLVLGRTLPFGDPTCPSSLSVVPTPESAMQTTEFLESHRNTARSAAGLKPETRTARPHATIARIKRRAAPALRAAALQWAQKMPPLHVEVHVNEVALYTWTEDRREQLFRIVARRFLGES